MLEWLLELRWPVSAVISDKNVTKNLNDHLLKIYCHLPKRSKLLLRTYLNEEENVSLSTVLLGVLGLAENLHNLYVDTDDSLFVQSFKHTVKAAILRRWNMDYLSPLLFFGLDPVLNS